MAEAERSSYGRRVELAKIDNSGDVEIDMIAFDEINRRIRFGSCKISTAGRSPEALKKIIAHVDRFLATMTGAPYRNWTAERTLYAPIFTETSRESFKGKRFVCVDLADFERRLAF